MLKKMLAIILCAFCLAGCGGGSGGGNSSVGGGDPKKEVQALCDQYIKAIEQTTLEFSDEQQKVEDWSQELQQLIIKYKAKYETITENIEQEKVSKGAEVYKSALKAYSLYWVNLFDICEKQVAYELENKSEQEKKDIAEKATQLFNRQNQLLYEVENEYSKIVKGKPALVMGIEGVNYLAFSSSKVDIAITKVRKEEGAIGSNPFLQQEPMGKFVIVEVYMKNNQKDAITVDANSFKLVDSEGREYSSSPEGHMALAVEQDSKAKGMLTRLNPNMGTSFTFVFDVPKELPGLTTKFEAKGGMTGKPTLMPLRPIKIETVKD